MVFKEAVLLLLIAAAACSVAVQPPSPAVVATSVPTPAIFTDPFAYCASVGTLDAPDARYTGTPVPDSIIDGFQKAAGITSSTEPLEQWRKSTIWRCMDGVVYACNFGANLPCDSRADTNGTPSPAMSDFCNANPNSDFIPLSVTGHATVYYWKCVNGSAQAGNPVSPVDGRGYLQRIWYPLRPGP